MEGNDFLRLVVDEPEGGPIGIVQVKPTTFLIIVVIWIMVAGYPHPSVSREIDPDLPCV